MKKEAIIGAFLKVPIDKQYHTYARALRSHLFAFYDFRTDSNVIDLDAIENSKILFKLYVHENCIKKGFWKVVGHKDLAPDLQQSVPFFKQQIGAPDVCWIDEGGVRVPATLDECVRLERLAVWDHDHVEDRLKDHYNGVPNKWVESMALNRIP